MPLDLGQSKYHVICAEKCGFRVADDYFLVKKQFSPGVCPRCGAGILIVEPYRDIVIPGVHMVTNPDERRPLGAIVPDEVIV